MRPLTWQWGWHSVARLLNRIHGAQDHPPERLPAAHGPRQETLGLPNPGGVLCPLTLSVGLTRFGGHLINPTMFGVEVCNDQIYEGRIDAGPAGV